MTYLQKGFKFSLFRSDSLGVVNKFYESLTLLETFL